MYNLATDIILFIISSLLHAITTVFLNNTTIFVIIIQYFSAIISSIHCQFKYIFSLEFHPQKWQSTALPPNQMRRIEEAKISEASQGSPRRDRGPRPQGIK